MIHFDFDEEDVVSNENKMLVCPIHGEYPSSLKQFGCPDCQADDLDEEELDDWRDRQVRKGGFKER